MLNLCFFLQTSSALSPEGLIEKHGRRKSNRSSEVGDAKKNSDNHFPFSCIVSIAFSHLSFDSIQEKTLLFHCYRNHKQNNRGSMRQTKQLFVPLRTKLFVIIIGFCSSRSDLVLPRKWKPFFMSFLFVLGDAIF